jgi:predicted AAA+ superfamily ATPase
VIIENYYRQFPDYRGKETVVWCFDEIQVIAGWERFVRRVMDSEKVEIFVSGSSARMLSREVATSMRGRAMETVVTPFSWREYLRANGSEPKPGKQIFSPTERSRIEALFEDYLEWGGFPETLKLTTDRERIELLQGYVDIVLLRDIGERHGVGNLTALRAFVRQLLRHPARPLSISKTYRDFQSRGIAVAKGTLLEFLEHLEDAFLVFSLPLAVGSERRRQTNPRKLYLSDHALARAFATASGLDRGRMIENMVACVMKWSCRDVGYLLTDEGYEIDFLGQTYDGKTLLIQVASNLSEPSTWQREIRALESARSG